MQTANAMTERKPDIPAIVSRYIQGEDVPKLAAEAGVHRTTLYRWMMSEMGDQHADVVTAALIRRVADADGELDAAADACDIARAREKARFARMDFERRRPHLYGPRQHIDMTVTTTDLGDRLRAAKERVVGAGSTAQDAVSSAQPLPKK